MQDTVIGLFDTLDDARAAENDLITSGFSRDRVHLGQGEAPPGTTGAHGDKSAIGNFFRSLFGMENEEDYRAQHDIYAEAMRRGGVMLSVDTDTDQERNQAVSILQRHHPVDVEKRAESWRSEGWSGYDATAPRYTEDQVKTERARYPKTGATATTTDQAHVPIIEEQLKVGKRMVDHGGVRIVRRVKETPVHESVDLRKEEVQVERKRVDKPATEADLAAFKEGEVEIRETIEEPVVSKEARIVEEVDVDKHVAHEKADIDDTVRRTEVDVQRAGGQARGTAGDTDYRTHWQNVYGSSGGSYEDYDAAYRYGASVGSSERFRNYRWEDAEPQLRSEWETRHPESKWDRVKDAVRYGAENSSGRGAT